MHTDSRTRGTINNTTTTLACDGGRLCRTQTEQKRCYSLNGLRRCEFPTSSASQKSRPRVRVCTSTTTLCIHVRRSDITMHNEYTNIRRYEHAPHAYTLASAPYLSGVGSACMYRYMYIMSSLLLARMSAEMWESGSVVLCFLVDNVVGFGVHKATRWQRRARAREAAASWSADQRCRSAF